MRGLFPKRLPKTMPAVVDIANKNLNDAYGILLPTAKHKDIRKLKKKHEPSVHGHKTWSASFALMDYLLYHPLKKNSRVLEIGCGWGPASMFCAKHFSAEMTALDIDPEVFPYLEVVAKINKVKVEPLVSKFEKLTDEQLSQFDVIIGSDICFWDELVKPLSKLIDRSLAAGVKRVIITDPGRPTFYEVCGKMKKKHKTVQEDWYVMDPKFFQGDVLEVRAK